MTKHCWLKMTWLFNRPCSAGNDNTFASTPSLCNCAVLSELLRVASTATPSFISCCAKALPNQPQPTIPTERLTEISAEEATVLLMALFIVIILITVLDY